MCRILKKGCALDELVGRVTARPERSRMGARRSLHRAVNGVQRTARPTSIKQRQRRVIRPTDPCPILRSFAQPFAKRIHGHARRERNEKS
jgi:hypothetical protein